MKIILMAAALLSAHTTTLQQTADGGGVCKWRVRVFTSATDNKILATVDGRAESLTIVGPLNNRMMVLRIPPNAKAYLEQRVAPLHGRFMELSVGDSVVDRGTINGAVLPTLLRVGSESAVRGNQRLRVCLVAAAKL